MVGVVQSRKATRRWCHNLRNAVSQTRMAGGSIVNAKGEAQRDNTKWNGKGRVDDACIIKWRKVLRLTECPVEAGVSIAAVTSRIARTSV